MEEETNGGDCCTGWYWVCVPPMCCLFSSTCGEALCRGWLPNDTLLRRAVKTGASPAAIEVLLEAGYDPDAKNLEVVLLLLRVHSALPRLSAPTHGHRCDEPAQPVLRLDCGPVGRCLRGRCGDDATTGHAGGA